MNSYQELWWQQARSDHKTFILLRTSGVPQCHSLHHLQMATEKIAKAYFWRSGSPPPKSHAGFVQFLRFLGGVRPHHRERVAGLFSFKNFASFENWIRAILPTAYLVEHLAPDLAKDGPNPEYPWPHAEPSVAPVNHRFRAWDDLTTGKGRQLMRVIQIAVERFPEYADT